MEARDHVAVLMTNLAWLMGASEQAGIAVPERFQQSVDGAIDFLSIPDEPEEGEKSPPKKTAAKKEASS